MDWVDEDLLYVYLFYQDSYFSGISADASALIHDYAYMLENNEVIHDYTN